MNWSICSRYNTRRFFNSFRWLKRKYMLFIWYCSCLSKLLRFQIKKPTPTTKLNSNKSQINIWCCGTLNYFPTLWTLYIRHKLRHPTGKQFDHIPTIDCIHSCTLENNNLVFIQRVIQRLLFYWNWPCYESLSQIYICVYLGISHHGYDGIAR